MTAEDLDADQEVTVWLKGLAKGDESAIGHIWEVYFDKLVAQAKRKIGRGNRRVFDEEDAALSAFQSLCRGAAEGRFPRLEDRENLWKLLVTITARKVVAHQRHAHAQKRYALGESVLEGDASPESRAGGIAQVLGREPSPEFAAELNDECEHLLDALNDGSLKTVALYTLEGYGSAEIAEELGYSQRTIQKKLSKIREKWSSFLE